jgi:hypothetical protein
VWKTPFTKKVSRAHQADGAAQAPHWWRGDEDASQAFLLSMGVRVADNG